MDPWAAQAGSCAVSRETYSTARPGADASTAVQLLDCDRENSRQRLCTLHSIASTAWLWYGYPLGAEVDRWD